MTETNLSQEKLTTIKTDDEDVEIVENGALSPQPSMRTDDDACSEIIRIEQESPRDEEATSAFGRFVRTLQVFEYCLV